MALRQNEAGWRVTHALFFVELALFLALVVGSHSPWSEELLAAASLQGAEALLARPWALLTYWALHTHPLEFVVASGLLLLVGVRLERALGRAGFLALFMGGAVLTGLAHVALRELGVVRGAFSGSLGASAGLLTASLFLGKSLERSLGAPRAEGDREPIAFPAFYLLAACFLFVSTLLIQTHNRVELQQRVTALQESAYRAENRSFEQRAADLERVAALRASLPDSFSHLLGLACGGLSLLCLSGLGASRERLRLRREILGLQAEVDARARVETLLAKISCDGIESLTRPERRFLRYASRFYRPEVNAG